MFLYNKNFFRLKLIILMLFHLCLKVHLSFSVPQTASKILIPVQMSYFYDFHLLVYLLVLVFPDLKICLFIFSQLFHVHLKFQLFHYFFHCMQPYIFTFVFYFFLIILISFQILSVLLPYCIISHYIWYLMGFSMKQPFLQTY